MLSLTTSSLKVERKIVDSKSSPCLLYLYLYPFASMLGALSVIKYAYRESYEVYWYQNI